MGVFSFLSGNYKPADFANKTLEQIFKEIKLDKVDKSIQQHAEFNALPEETKSAIQMLIDLKEGKDVIYSKCYKGKDSAQHGPGQHGPAQHGPTQHGPTQHGPAPASLSRQIPKPLSFSKNPAALEKVPPPVVESEEGQTGGGRRRRRRKTGKKNKKSRHSKIKKSRKYMRK